MVGLQFLQTLVHRHHELRSEVIADPHFRSDETSFSVPSSLFSTARSRSAARNFGGLGGQKRRFEPGQ
jgi:hypothetical protein